MKPTNFPLPLKIGCLIKALMDIMTFTLSESGIKRKRRKSLALSLFFMLLILYGLGVVYQGNPDFLVFLLFAYPAWTNFKKFIRPGDWSKDICCGFKGDYFIFNRSGGEYKIRSDAVKKVVVQTYGKTRINSVLVKIGSMDYLKYKDLDEMESFIDAWKQKIGEKKVKYARWLHH